MSKAKLLVFLGVGIALIVALACVDNGASSVHAAAPKRRVEVIETTAVPGDIAVYYVHDPAAKFCAMVLDRANGGAAIAEIACERLGLDPK